MSQEAAVAYINDYLHQIEGANLELPKKEAFKALLVRLYDHDEEARRLINDMTMGAERSVTHIKLEGRSKTGRADTLYRNTIIEFENNLAKTHDHAKEQLKEYVSGQWNSGQPFNYVLIATDCRSWYVYSIGYEELLKLGTEIGFGDVTLIQRASFTLTHENAAEFYSFIDRWLFRKTQQAATLDAIRQAFGEYAPTFNAALSLLREHLDSIWLEPDTQVAYDQWNRFLQIAYGQYTAGKEAYLVHTYLSVFAKLLAYHLLSDGKYPTDDTDLRRIVSGEVFGDYQLVNLVEDDFYHWPADPTNVKALRRVFYAILDELHGFDFSHVAEDILKGVYQELIDIDTRHALGEYYTPDWLCERMVQACDFGPDTRVLDPSCGSGSFLRVALDRLIRENPDKHAHELAQQVVGIDIHPLSVQIAKVTLVIALKDKLRASPRPAKINIFLANTIFLPEYAKDQNEQSLFSKEFFVDVDGALLEIAESVYSDTNRFDEVIDVCDALAETEKGKPNSELNIESFAKKISVGKTYHFTSAEEQSFYEIYKALLKAKKENRDKIWSFILKNLYKPRILRGQFDYVLGNPPWIEFRYISTKRYQDELNRLADKYGVKPKNQRNNTHLDIAAIFLAHACQFFLKPEGQLGYVLPRGFLTGEQHDNTRSGAAHGFRLTACWDLLDVDRVFNVPSCVLWAKPTRMNGNGNGHHLPATAYANLPGLAFKGRLPGLNMDWAEAKPFLTEQPVEWFYSTMGTNSALTNEAGSFASSDYKDLFKLGATLFPRGFYFVKPVIQDLLPINDYKGRVIPLESDPDTMRDAKKPWDKIYLRETVESNLLFHTALARNIVPFTLVKPLQWVLLPAGISDKGDLEIYDQNALQDCGYFKAATKWFPKVDELWETYKTERSGARDYLGRIDYHRGLSAQNITKPFLVMFTVSGKDANAVVFDRSSNPVPFVVDYKTYWFTPDCIEEADYIASFLNSNIANKMMKPYQSQGSFGPRDVSKKILGLPFRKFDAQNADHQALAALGATCRTRAAEYVASAKLGHLTGPKLGSARLEIRKYLGNELAAIDVVLKRLLGL